MNLLEIRRQVDRLLADRRAAIADVRREKEALAAAEQDAQDLTEARRVLQAVAAAVQRQAHRRLASVVTRCLKAVFQDDAYAFKVKFIEKRGKTEAELKFVRGGLELDPLDAAGGGVCDVASMGLRLSCLMLARPPLRRLLILDENFKHLSSEYRPAVRRLIERLATELGVQFVLVSHSTELRIGKVIRIGDDE